MSLLVCSSIGWISHSEGGFFNAIMSFPSNYPNSPPSVKFTSEIWHPNVYPDGRVCISILHPPGEDPNGYELASERWTPVHTQITIVEDLRVKFELYAGPLRGTDPEYLKGIFLNGLREELKAVKLHPVESIVLSIISMLSSPNDESPANVEAAKEWRDRRDDFKKKVSRCVRKSQEML
ncbi:Ubiquitin-conjugating enzyme E2 7 [Glycine max]|nr:Ubiquitin-conjugating enzyme E2 7 [Glycine max]